MKIQKNFAPIIIFAYNRRDTLILLLNSLFDCFQIEHHEIHVFCDGPKSEQDKIKTSEVQNYLKEFAQKKRFSLHISNKNKGLARSVIEGTSQIFQKNDSIIVLEDDLVVSKNFLIYMNDALEHYKDDKAIFSISGYTPQLTELKNYLSDVYFSPRASSWAWGTWKNRWKTVDWNVESFSNFNRNPFKKYQFAKGGIDLPRMLRNQMEGKIDSWAIRWVYQQFLNEQVTVYPKISKVINTGINMEATHTKKTRRFNTALDQGEQLVFIFESFQGYNYKLLRQFRSIFSIWRRLLDRI